MGGGGVGWGGKRVGEGWGLLVSRPADQITAAIGSSGSMRGQSQPSWVRLGKSVPALMDKNHLHLNVTFLPQPQMKKLVATGTWTPSHQTFA